MTKKIVFIVNSLQQQRCFKRINEFISQGYEVDVYGFNRNPDSAVPEQPFNIHVLGSFDNTLSYFKRLILMYKLLRPIIKKYKKEDVIFFYFMLDVALVCRFITRKKYIYEEYDLMQTYIRSNIIVRILNAFDRNMMRHALITITSSEGFIKYHFKDYFPDNVCLVPNRLNPNILQFPYTDTGYDIKHLRIGFVGVARFDSIIYFTKVFAENYPQHEIHFYGTKTEKFDIFNSFKNVFFHGPFINPNDLPKIYQNVDLILATYDTRYDNVRYAEPNKLYEAIYFKKPIIVSKDTFLADKTQQLGVGFAVDSMNDGDIIRFFDSLSGQQIEQCKYHAKQIPTQQLMDCNPDLFKMLTDRQ